MKAAAVNSVTTNVTDDSSDFIFNDFITPHCGTHTDSMVLLQNRFSVLDVDDDSGSSIVDCDIPHASNFVIDEHVSCDSAHVPHNVNNFKGLSYKLDKVNGLKIGHINVRSLLPKIDQIRYVISKCNFDIFCINESWLDDTILPHEYGVDGYSDVAKHRNRHGGGVIIYVKNCISFKKRSDLETDILECLWIEFTYDKKPALLCSMYRPPSACTTYYNHMLDCIEKACLEDKFTVITGDLNFNYVLDETLCKNPLHLIETSNELKQLVDSYTRVTPTCKSLIDVILSSHPDLHQSTGVCDLALSDHRLVYTVINCNKSSSKKQIHNEITYRNYKNFDVHRFNADLINSNVLQNVVNINDVNVAWNTFKSEFLRICNNHAPLCTSRVKNRYNPWINNEIVKLMYRRDFLHREMVRNPSDDVINEFKAVRHEVNIKIKDAKCLYFETLYAEGKSNPKALWSEMRKLAGKTKCDPSSDLTAEQFNNHFCNIGNNVTSHFPSSSNLLWKGPSSIHHFKFKNISEDSVLKLLKGLSLSSSLDLLSFDCKLLRLSCESIVSHVTHLFNLTFTHGLIPKDWKVARVSPVYKKSGVVNNASNYRPISVLGFLAKLIEKDVQCQLMSYLIVNDFITLDQSAYKKFHSTSSCLHTTIDEWLQNFDDKLYTGICFLDIAKCFDTINHDLLLSKLVKYGVNDVELKWFKSYLCDRQQFVCYRNSFSNYGDVTLGVPQGSTLGPLLFMLFVNDLPIHINGARCAMYADDTAVFVSSDSVEGVNQKLNSVLGNVYDWYTSNRLVLNIDKSNAMLINNGSLRDENDTFEVLLNNTHLNTVHSTKYLGVHVDDQLQFHCHLDNLVKKLSSKLSWLCRLRHSVPRNVLELTFNLYIQPLFDYACTVWGCSKTNVDIIQRLQNRAARIICSDFDIINTRGIDLVKQLKWQTITDRINYFLSIMMYNCVYGNAPAYLSNSIVMACETNDVNTRLNDTLQVHIPDCRTNAMKKSFIYRGSVVWNQLPSNLHEASSVDVFKKGAKLIFK